MKNSFIINTKTTGDIRNEVLDGSDHYVLDFKAIESDSVMNEILYPKSEVEKSIQQFEMLHMPVSHPKVNGESVSATHPVAINNFNVGAFCKNVTIKNNSVFGELWLNKEVANAKKLGQELLTKIENGDYIGVSTGGSATLEPTTGIANDDKPYKYTSSNYEWNHIAILLNEAPAGKHVNTAIFNEELNIFNLGQDSQTADDDIKKEVKGEEMEITKEMLAEYTFEQKFELIKMVAELVNEEELMQIKEYFVPKKEAEEVEKADEVEEAEEVENVDKTLYNSFIKNQEKFAKFLENEQKELEALKQNIIENSNLEITDIENMSKETLVKLNNSFKKTIDNSLRNTKTKEEVKNNAYSYAPKY